MDGKMTHRPGIASPEEDPNAEILCASPPCFMHELDPSWLGPQSWEHVRAWRRTERFEALRDARRRLREAQKAEEAR